MAPVALRSSCTVAMHEMLATQRARHAACVCSPMKSSPCDSGWQLVNPAPNLTACVQRAAAVFTALAKGRPIAAPARRHSASVVIIRLTGQFAAPAARTKGAGALL